MRQLTNFPALSMAISADLVQAYVATQGGNVRSLNLKANADYTLPDQLKITAVTASWENNVVAFAGRAYYNPERTVPPQLQMNVWRDGVWSGYMQLPAEVETHRATKLLVSPNGQHIAALTSGWDIDNVSVCTNVDVGYKVQLIDGPYNMLNATCAWGRDNRLHVLGRLNRNAKHGMRYIHSVGWLRPQTRTFKNLPDFQCANDPRAVAVGPDDRLWATYLHQSMPNCPMILRTTESDAQVLMTEAVQGAVHAAEFSPDTSMLLVGTNESRVYLFRRTETSVETVRIFDLSGIYQSAGSPKQIYGFCWQPNGDTFVALTYAGAFQFDVD